jgi:hypothetical protein
MARVVTRAGYIHLIAVDWRPSLGLGFRQFGVAESIKNLAAKFCCILIWLGKLS